MKLDAPWIRNLVLFLLLFGLTVSAFGWTFAPMVAEIELGAGQPRLTYTINNDNATPIAVQISVVTREISIDGEETRSPADDVIVYPSQLVVAGGESRTVIVEWTGSSTDVELAYRVVAEQVPVDFGNNSEARARIRMNLRFVTSLYVRPPGVAPGPRVVEAAITNLPEGVIIGGRNGSSTASGEAYGMVLLENRGGSRVDLSEVTYRVAWPRGSEAPLELEPASTSAPVGVLLPGDRRRIYVALPRAYAALNDGTSLSVTVEQ